VAFGRITTGFSGYERLGGLLQIVAAKTGCKGLLPYGCPMIGIMPGQVKTIRTFSYSVPLPVSCPMA